jgi:hypothetical protein
MTTPRICAADRCDAPIPAEARADKVTCSIACRVAISRANNRPADQPKPRPHYADQESPEAAPICQCGGRPWTDPEGEVRCLSCGKAPGDLPDDLPPLRLAMAVLMKGAA